MEHIYPEMWRGFDPALVHICWWDIVVQQKLHIGFYVLTYDRMIGVIIIGHESFTQAAFNTMFLRRYLL